MIGPRRWELLRLSPGLQTYFDWIVRDIAMRDHVMTMRGGCTWLRALEKRQLVDLRPLSYDRGRFEVQLQPGAWRVAGEQAQAFWRHMERFEVMRRLGA